MIKKFKVIFIGLKGISILFFTIFISRSVNAAPMPSVYFWGSFDNARVFDRPIPDESLQAEWQDISGLSFLGILRYVGIYDSHFEYTLDMMIPTYTFNAVGGSFYQPVPFIETVTESGDPLDPVYTLSDTLHNYVSTIDATFNPDGTGSMSASIGDLFFVGKYQFETTFHHAPVPEPSTLLLLGSGLAGLGFWRMRKNNK